MRTVQLDSILLDYLSDEQLSRLTRMAIAIELFHHDHVSLGACAELAQMDQTDFLEELNRRNIPFYSYDDPDEELRRELFVIEDMDD